MKTDRTATEQSLAENVRRLRERAHMSVRTLASKSGFSASFISQLENGQASPSIASLERILSILGVTLGDFFHSVSSNTPCIIKVSDRPAVQSEWSRAKLEGLSPSIVGQRLESVMMTLAAGGRSGKRPYVRAFEQLAIVFEGEVLLTLDDQEYELRRGDAVTILPETLRRWQNKSLEPVQVILVTVRSL